MNDTKDLANPDQTWTTDELQRDFRVEGFSMGCVVAVHKETGERGTMIFSGSPRQYFGWRADDGRPR